MKKTLKRVPLRVTRQWEGVVGPHAWASGMIGPARVGRSGELIVSDAHARYMEPVLRGRVFRTTNTAIQAPTAVTATTMTGLGLRNPPNSGRNLILLEIYLVTGIVLNVGDVPGWSLGAIVNPLAAAPTSVTSLAIFNALIGSGRAVAATAPAPGSVAQAYSAATLAVAPVVVRQLWGLHQKDQAASPPTGITQIAVKDDVSGALVLAPGTSINIGRIGASPAFVGALMWEEVPV